MGKILRRAYVVLAVSIAGASATSSCAIPGEIPPASTAIAEPGSPTPTRLCRLVEGVPAAKEDCVVADPEAAMAVNELYRQRRALTPDMQNHLAFYLDPARRALDALSEPPTAKVVVEQFELVGLPRDSVQTDDNGNGVRFGVASPQGGCLFGFVALDGQVDISTGGSIMDGGCLDMVGH
ncbi:hypothetical protein [Arthrobacter sp. ISL-95]|uniref:hypothetical protein n=1 Tax=Arthrobacter sp. ISL-95 TaxID=2819116 RepID=UPI001BE6F0B1|nr:hypothetical protein [Arthrobacter sp. ISL-95]MBT2586675.1 hypothetical protein [Arthrobacter sp. ISL-95]